MHAKMGKRNIELVSKDARESAEETYSGSSEDDVQGPTSSEGSSSSSAESSDDEDGEAFESVTVDFDFGSPEESNFHGLKYLLANYLDGAQYATSRLVDLVLEEADISTVVKTGEDDVMGVTTVLPLSKVHQKVPEVVEYFRSKSENETFIKALTASDCGLLLSERVRNFPAEIAPHLLDTLLSEIKDSAKAKYLKRVVYVSRAFLLQSAPSTSKGKAAKTEELVYTQPEAEVFAPRARALFKYPIAALTSEESQQFRVVMLLDLDRVRKSLPKLEQLVGE